MRLTRQPTRRQLLAAGNGLAALLVVSLARADPASMASAIAGFTGGPSVTPGKVSIDIPPLVENGNSVPVTLRVDSPMTVKNFVRSLALFVEKNPQPHAGVYHFSPRSGRAIVSTRLRLATSQTLVAIACLSDGSYWSASADVIVTLAACTES